VSKNFELLIRMVKELGVFQPLGAPPSPALGKRPEPEVDARTREELMKLVQRVFLSPRLAEVPRAVLFSAVDQGDGSSRICARVGEALAGQTPGSVCIVDANLRSPTLHEQFALENGIGLKEAVMQFGPVRRFAQRYCGTNLWLVTCGSQSPDPHTILASDRLGSRIRELCAEFDHVLIDSPPLSLYADAFVLGQLTDGIILVVEANSTRREVAQKAKENLEAASLRILGSVLNNRTFPIPETIYWKL